MNFRYKYSIIIGRLLLMTVMALAAFAPFTSHGQSASLAASALAGQSFGEYEIKAGFIYKFISFVSWPADMPDNGAITIAILGKNPFGNAFKSAEGSTVAGRVVRVKFFKSDADYAELKTCQMLYISSSEEEKLTAVLKAVEDSPVLTIGDSKGFVDKGGMIGFVRKGKEQIGIEINDASANRAHLSIRSMLKRIAVRIIPDSDHPKNDGIR